MPEAARRAILAAEAKAAELNRKAQEEAAEKAREASAALLANMPTRRERFTAELEINDYPQTARFKVCNKESLSGITEFTKAAITAKGQYYPPGRNPPAGERKLYFLIEGETEAAVKAARKELRRSLDEYSAIAAPAEESKYGKYRVA